MKQLRVVCAFVLLLGSVALAQTNPVPIVYQPLAPMTIKPGSKGFTLTVNGFGFATDALVAWNGKTRITTFVSNSQLQIQVRAADVANPGTASISVVNPGPGGGTSNFVFFPIQTATSVVAMFPVAGFSGSGVNAAGDFNRDSFLDLAVGRDLFIDFYAGKGDGTFAAASPNHSVVPVISMIAADFDGDGDLDLAVLDGIGDTTIFLNGQAKGAFLQQQALRTWNGGLATGDFNGDGKLDLVVTGSTSSALYLGNGDGTFGSPHFVSGSFGQPAAGDFDGDGKLDLAIASFDEIDVLLGNGDGTFRTNVAYQGGGTSVAAADFNGDGILDLAIDGPFVLLGNGDGTFTPVGGFKKGESSRGGKPRNVGSGPPLYVGDFNGDGKLDIAVNGALFLGNGDGTFQTPVQLANDSFSAMGDFNGDGKLDLVGHFLYLQGFIYLNPKSLDFGNQKVGTKSSAQPATLTNGGSSALTITSIEITGTNPQDFSQTNNCGSSLPPGEMCTIQVVFQPQAEGSRSASLNVNYQGLGSPQTVSLTGVGQVATATLTPANIKFPLQLVGTTSSPQAAALTNTGNLPVNISNISTTAQFTQTNNCPSSLPVGGSCQIQVEFVPQRKGQIAGTLSVADDAQGSPQTAALSGSGSVVKLSAKGISFGNRKVGTKSRAVPVKLTNLGKGSLMIHQISIEGTNAGDFSQTNNCGSKLPGGGSCTIKVIFAPQAKGKRSASVQITDNDPSSPQEVVLTGNGT